MCDNDLNMNVKFQVYQAVHDSTQPYLLPAVLLDVQQLVLFLLSTREQEEKEKSKREDAKKSGSTK